MVRGGAWGEDKEGQEQTSRLTKNGNCVWIFRVLFARMVTYAGHVTGQWCYSRLWPHFCPLDPALQGERNVLGL